MGQVQFGPLKPNSSLAGVGSINLTLLDIDHIYFSQTLLLVHGAVPW